MAQIEEILGKAEEVGEGLKYLNEKLSGTPVQDRLRLIMTEFGTFYGLLSKLRNETTAPPTRDIQSDLRHKGSLPEIMDGELKFLYRLWGRHLMVEFKIHENYHFLDPTVQKTDPDAQKLMEYLHGQGVEVQFDESTQSAHLSKPEHTKEIVIPTNPKIHPYFAQLYELISRKEGLKKPEVIGPAIVSKECIDTIVDFESSVPITKPKPVTIYSRPFVNI